jgi:hypothetical protein
LLTLADDAVETVTAIVESQKAPERRGVRFAAKRSGDQTTLQLSVSRRGERRLCPSESKMRPAYSILHGRGRLVPCTASRSDGAPIGARAQKVLQIARLVKVSKTVSGR